MTTIAWGGAAAISFWIMGEVLAQEATMGSDWQSRPSISFVTNQTGVTLQTNTVVFLAGGMNRWDTDLGAWVSSVPELVVTDQGVIGRGGRHEVHFAPNINSEAATQIRLPGGQSPQWLKTHLLGLFYEDSSSGTNVMIADLQDSAAQVVGSQVWYFDAFTGIKAHVRYSYTRSGISQEIHIRERLPDPAIYNMSPGSVQLVAITEIAEGPEPQTEERLWQSGQVTERDQCLDFGSMRMVPGAAFVLGPTRNDEAAVRKEYRIIDGRRVILERVRLGQVGDQLQRLPEMNSLTNGTASITKPVRLLAMGKLPPVPHGSAASLHAAQGTALEPAMAFVLDWDLVHSTLRDFTFRAAPRLSYVVADDVRLAGTTTINPDAVVRFDSGSLYLDGPLNVPNTLRKPVLTSMQDQSVGPALRHSEGPRVGQYVPGLVVRAQDYTNAMQRIRVRHPAARITPDRPTRLPRVRIERASPRALATDGQPMPLKVIRTGGDMSQPLTVNYRIGATANGIEEVRISSAVIIPANTNVVEVPIPTMSQSGDDQDSTFVVTLEPESTGTYVSEGPLAGISSLGGTGISPMFFQAPGGMVGWWRAENNANDSSGGNRNGTANNGATYAAGWVGQAFSFDGLNDYVEVQDSAALELASSLTIEFWIKRQRLTGAYEYLFEKGGNRTSGHQNYALQIHGPDNGLCLTWNWGYRIAGVINDLNWHHCAVTAINAPADPVFYIDGWPQSISQRYGTGVNLNSSSSLPLHIGAQIDGVNTFYSQALIDEMTLYNQALSQNQVQSIFNSGRAGKSTASPSCTAIPSGMVSWWRGENNANDSYGVNGATFGGSYMGGQVGQTFRIIDSASVVTIPASTSLNVGTGNGFTVEGWMNVYDDDTGGHPVFEWAGANYGVQMWANYSSLGCLFVNLFDTSGVSHYYWVYSCIQSKTMTHFALTYDHTSGYAEVLINGVSVDRRNVGVFTPQTSWPLYLGFRPSNLGGGPRAFNGVIDEASLYSRALSAAEVSAIYAAQSSGKCVAPPMPPNITMQPQSQTVAAWSDATFSVGASGTIPLNYQWRLNGNDIPGATANTFTRHNVEPCQAGVYSVFLSNVAGSATSAGATLTVTQPDTDVDGLPDWWEMKFFGGLSQTGNADYDSDGVSNADEYLNGTDPNSISFSTEYSATRINSQTVNGTITVVGGVPSQMAILVDAANHSAANWVAYSSTFAPPLPPADGPHVVQVGLRGRSTESEQTWDSRTIWRDTTAPLVIITNPPSSTVSRPMIQLQGYSTEPLSSLRYDLSNSSGTQSDLQGFVSHQCYDTNIQAFTTNFFQCYDIDMASGVNTITLRATDLAGNVATQNFVYNLVSDSVAPVITIRWPQNAMKLCGTSFSLDGSLDDPTAVVALTITPVAGAPSTFNGLVERDPRTTIRIHH
jgi:hypothetical protein